MGQAAAPARPGSAGAPRYARHRPEQTLLYRIVAQHYPGFLELLAGQGRSLPDTVQQEFEAYLKCGRLEHGFLRVRCESWHAEQLVAFSCKRHGFCPRCGARRMAQSATLRRSLSGPADEGCRPAAALPRPNCANHGLTSGCQPARRGSTAASCPTLHRSRPGNRRAQDAQEPSGANQRGIYPAAYSCGAQSS